MAEVERYLNVDTFVDYFIINEFFMNYDAGLHSTYLHQRIGDTLEIGPLWDFDGAMDNYDKDLGVFYETAMEVRSYLDLAEGAWIRRKGGVAVPRVEKDGSFPGVFGKLY